MPAFKTIVVPVKDVESAKAVYSELLGVPPHTDVPFYVGFNVDGCELGLNPAGFNQGMTGPVAYVDVPNIEASVAALTAAGAQVLQPPTTVGPGVSIATLADADSNKFGLRAFSE